jgi:hypothetical protein
MIAVGAHIAPEVLTMQSASRSRVPPALALGLGLLLPLWAGGEVAAFQQPKDKDDNSKRVTFKTCDGVELGGTFYPNPGGKRDACVLLLHNFDQKKGGDSHKDGWDHLAQELQKAGYAVLSFDFRGFGDSKNVEKEFWNLNRNPHNSIVKGARMAKPPETIDQKDFPGVYYPYLVNDVAAARAYLERQNDAQQVNLSNLIVIGAGEGALLGQLWVTSEWRRRKVVAGGGGGVGLDDTSEGRDVMAVVHLSLSPSLAGRSLANQLHGWVIETGAEFKVPITFVHGEKDDRGRDLAKKLLNDIKNPPNGIKKPEKLEFTEEKVIDGTELTGSQLLQNSLDTEKVILGHLDKLLDKRGAKEWRKRETTNPRIYYWAVPGQRPVPAKDNLEEMIRPLPLRLFGIQ